MKMIDLIRHYDRDKSQHGPLSESLSPKLVQLMSVFGDMPADATGLEIVARCKTRMPGAKPGTQLRVLSQLRAVLRVGERDNLIERAPHITMPTVYDVVDSPVTPSETFLLLSHMKWTARKWWPLAMVLTHTGARLSEALRLRAQDFTEAGVTMVKPVARRTKTVMRVVPLTKQLRAAWQAGELSISQGQRPLLTVAASFDGRYSAARSIAAQLGVAIKEACCALGLPEIRVHDLRHVFAAIVAEQGGDLADIASLLGHTKLETTLRYRGLVKNRAKELLENV